MHRAASDFAESWNARKPTGIKALPNELQVDCLSQLSVRERIRASHVSRGWRQIVIHSATLWNSVPTRQTFTDSAGLFEMMVTRSGGAPLDIEFVPLAPEPHASLTDEAARAMRQIRILLASAMSRMRSLHVGLSDGTVHDPIIWNSPAPWLESLTIQHPFVVQIPPSWFESCVPNLRALHLGAFELPSTPARATSLEIFSGSMSVFSAPDRISTDARSLFKHFPRIVTLSLGSIVDTLMLPNTRPPATLRQVVLSASIGHDVTGDLASVLHRWRSAPTLHSISIHGFPEFSIAAAVAFYATASPGFWELTTSAWPTLIKLQSASLVLTVAAGKSTIPIAVHDASDFRMLRSLTLDGFWIPDFLALGLYLPELVSLTILDAGYYNTASYEMLVTNGFHPMRVPVLESVRFAGRFTMESALERTELEYLPDFLHDALHYDAEMLEVLTITYPAVTAEVRSLLAFAFEVRCEGVKGQKWSLRLDDPVDDPSQLLADSDDEGFELLAPILSGD
ncbi:hypothetical protein AURDEDRAFT_174724 [Auricularia subglabra TFB-10046 SS5]|nr:hypothetical protein AURDEDRAFT_174724 [Auricularia subglabra TFB-10046 SS5]